VVLPARGDPAGGQVAVLCVAWAMMPANRMVDETPVTAAGLDPESAWWLGMLAGTGPRREAALARLRERAEGHHRQGRAVPRREPVHDLGV